MNLLLQSWWTTKRRDRAGNVIKLLLLKENILSFEVQNFFSGFNSNAFLVCAAGRQVCHKINQLVLFFLSYINWINKQSEYSNYISFLILMLSIYEKNVPIIWSSFLMCDLTRTQQGYSVKFCIHWISKNRTKLKKTKGYNKTMAKTGVGNIWKRYTS